ncbi:hypothetical protein [Reinekea marinisedimentorum]|uniref:Uncharacterized protein n=1 Tax=Reinekea marinisedimentorum TaxID=230495 RepID=A0A4R3I5P6_9GAMM|nr:hypothetical protein [Reinekea marinisedimentorum]TCS41327.1 hypothetical protein BCF53_10658 [Reinekea marinisedimentorum]
MSDQPKQSLIDDLEAIRHSLDKIAESEPVIPTLEEIVGCRPPTSVNPQNPFLSSNSLSELIRIRNEAEAREAEKLASVHQRIKPVEEIRMPEPSEQPAEQQPAVDGPNPDQIVAKLEAAFDTWKEKAIKEYLILFEQELNERLKQDFQELVRNWYREHNLIIPPAFLNKDFDNSND